MVCYPAIYYFVYPHSRYRHPIEPMMAILIAYVISEAGKNPAINSLKKAA
jgi:hypothetical protein